jgi:hypothetical protein
LAAIPLGDHRAPCHCCGQHCWHDWQIGASTGCRPQRGSAAVPRDGQQHDDCDRTARSRLAFPEQPLCLARWIFTSVLAHRFGRPVVQYSQVPQNTERQAITPSPGSTYLTSLPTASTTAEDWPRTAGVWIGYSPSKLSAGHCGTTQRRLCSTGPRAAWFRDLECFNRHWLMSLVEDGRTRGSSLFRWVGKIERQMHSARQHHAGAWP